MSRTSLVAIARELELSQSERKGLGKALIALAADQSLAMNHRRGMK